MYLKPVALIFAIALSMAIYYIFFIAVLPYNYNTYNLKPQPYIKDVAVPIKKIKIGESFTIPVNGVNLGDDADLQIISISFPNLTRIDTNNIIIKKYNFTQSASTIQTGEVVTPNYKVSGTTTIAKYPSIEASSRPWQSDKLYTIEVEIKPQQAGNFVFYVKAIAMPHYRDLAHYPQSGLVDYQNEYVKVYRINVG